MDYAEELPTKVSDTTGGEFQEYRARLALTIEGKNRGEKGKTL